MRVSSAGITSKHVLRVLLIAACTVLSAPGRAQQGLPKQNSQEKDPARIFQNGQEALNNGKLNEAERDFRDVLALDPKAGAAYANLGVVYMRRKQWQRAITELHRAEELMPQVTGIRLNIGLAYYRQNRFLKAIPSFEAVVRDQPDAVQARYLLGLCYFFVDRWSEAAQTLKPLWPRESSHFPYLYVLSNAAHRAGLEELDRQAAEQLTKIGDGSAQYHLFAGKYYLNREEYGEAIQEFEAAVKEDSKLPFAHFNLGLAHMKRQEYAKAREEFLKDAEIEPDMALNYEEIGNSYWLTQEDAKAEKSYKDALTRDPRLVNSMLGLAKIYERQQKYSAVLSEANTALKVDPERTDAHYLKAQALQKLGRVRDAKQELQAAAGNKGENPNTATPSPELIQEQQ